MVGRVDIITGTLGKALGGASGGFENGRREIADLDFAVTHFAAVRDDVAAG